MECRVINFDGRKQTIGIFFVSIVGQKNTNFVICQWDEITTRDRQQLKNIKFERWSNKLNLISQTFKLLLPRGIIP